MRFLVVGSGGREHALAWKLARSGGVERVYVAPGNAGIARTAECVDIRPEQMGALVAFARDQRIDLTVIGPEAPLVAGAVDRFREAGLHVFGPSRAAARLEGSKSYAKHLMRRHNIPTADFWTFGMPAEALAFLRQQTYYPLVVKCDGLAAGKGVRVCQTRAEAEAAVTEIMVDKVHGEAGEHIVIEEFLRGEEMSVLVVTDSHALVVLETARDHKTVFDGDLGPNTGGMGAVSPAPLATRETLEQIEARILVPAIHALNREGTPFKGVLYAGLMLTVTGPKVLEFNVRLGDPETQPILMRLRSDLARLLLAAAHERLDRETPEWDPRPAVCVVVASGGYPGNYRTGLEISGLEDVAESNDLAVFHAGTARRGNKVVTTGGRVLSVCALGDDLKAARDRAYDAVDRIRFDGAHHRSDIGLVKSSRRAPPPPDRHGRGGA